MSFTICELNGIGVYKLDDGRQMVYPSQCSCGHIILERFMFGEPRKDGCMGFDWCGFCRTRTDIFPTEPSPR